MGLRTRARLTISICHGCVSYNRRANGVVLLFQSGPVVWNAYNSKTRRAFSENPAGAAKITKKYFITILKRRRKKKKMRGWETPKLSVLNVNGNLIRKSFKPAVIEF